MSVSSTARSAPYPRPETRWLRRDPLYGQENLPAGCERSQSSWRLRTDARIGANQLGDGGLVVARVLSAGRCDVHAYFDQEDDQAFAAARHFSSRSSRTEGRFDRDPGWRRVRAYS
jgi:hypothetical protein